MKNVDPIHENPNRATPIDQPQVFLSNPSLKFLQFLEIQLLKSKSVKLPLNPYPLFNQADQPYKKIKT
jgi:hypothetical protein